MSTIAIHRSELLRITYNRSRLFRQRFRRTISPWRMTMMNLRSSDTSKKEVEVIKSSLKIPQVDQIRLEGLRFDRLQPPEVDFVEEDRLEVGIFVAREAMLDEEYWTAAWLRAESHWEDRATERNYIKRSVIKSVVGTLDLSIRFFLQGETFPGEKVKSHLVCSINREGSNRYGYISNLCVEKSARRQCIACNMLWFAVESARLRYMFMYIETIQLLRNYTIRLVSRSLKRDNLNRQMIHTCSSTQDNS